MAVFAIGDLHLSLSATDKPMDVFAGWQDYMQRLEQAWRQTVTDDDTVVLAGDTSWALQLQDCAADFCFLDSLPGRKWLLKGNHDYWWSSRSKMESYFASLGLSTLGILHNNAVQADGVWLCGSRGWMFENGEPHDKKIVDRETGRIAMSLAAAGEGEKLLFLHYPPALRDQSIPEFFGVMQQYGVARCFYGHLHGPAIAGAWRGNCRGVQLTLISADAVGFRPLKIL